MERLVKRLVEPKFWAPCQKCDLRDRCYVYHNVQTFANPTAGSQVLERLTLLYRLVTLRAKLHITLRDLRSALAFTIAGTRTCEEIHELFEQGAREEIVRGFYFNSWAGAGTVQHDRLCGYCRKWMSVGPETRSSTDYSIFILRTRRRC